MPTGADPDIPLKDFDGYIDFCGLRGKMSGNFPPGRANCMSASPATPRWRPRNLARHHRTRITDDAGCFEDLIGITGRTMTEAEYEARSLDSVENSWAEYEGVR